MLKTKYGTAPRKLLIRISLKNPSWFGSQPNHRGSGSRKITVCEGSGHEDQPPAIRIQQQQLRSARQYRLVLQDQVPAPVLGIPDIFVRIQIRGSLPQTNLFGSESYSGFSMTLRMQIKFFFLLHTFPFNLHAGTVSSVLNFFAKMLCWNFICMPYFSPLNTFMRKGKDPDPYLRLMDPDPEGPKTSGSPNAWCCFLSLRA